MGVFFLERVLIKRASLKDAELIHSMQVASFKPILDKYQDFDTNPANEGLERTIDRLNQQQTDYYLILYDLIPVGAVRIVGIENYRCRVSPIFVLPDYQGNGIAKAAMRLVEDMYVNAIVWELDTILEESKLCGLYESLGYIATGKSRYVKENMTIVSYEKMK
jgi:GNAT superfamily N-acetyltransferase